MKEILLSIGELASICNVTPKTLRHYDKLGLLRPAKINTQNGYRYYKKSHITRVTAIKQLQEIGVSLEQIGIFYKMGADFNIVSELEEMLTKQKNEILIKIEDYSKKLNKIQDMKSQCKDIRDNLLDKNTESFIIKELSDRNIIYIGYSGNYSSDIFREYYKSIWDSIIFSKEDERNIISPPLAIYSSIASTENSIIQIGYQVNMKLEHINISQKTIKGGMFACDVYQGSYGNLKKIFYDGLYENIRKSNYIITGDPIEIYHINEVFTDSSSNYLTEIQIPIQ